MRPLSSVLALLAVACADPQAGPAPLLAGPLAVEDGATVDTLGREVVLRGVNARVEGLFDVTFDDGRTPLEEIPAFGADDLAFLASQLGHDALRLPVNWSGIEPERGAYDAAYLARVLDVLDAAARAGVWVIVDLHQDAYSKEIGEDGAPLWAIQPPLTPDQLLEGPLDDLGARRTSPVVQRAFGSLWDDVDGLIDAYAAMAAHLAAAVADHPAVAGLELMNEPVIFTQVARLDAFHARVGAAVRAAAPELPILFEPNSLRNLTDAAPVTTPFPLDRAVYAPHVYTDVFETGWASEDEAAVRASVAAAREEATAHGAALYVGEFGADPSTELGRHYVATALDAFDAQRAGWAFWVYEESSQGAWGLYDRPAEGATRGALRGPIADLLARPFPRAVDGRLVALAWDAATATLTVDLADAGEGAHQLTRPARTWPGPVVATCDGDDVDVHDAGATVEVVCAGARLVVRPG